MISVNLELKEGKTLEEGQKVLVYRNLKNGKISIKDYKSNRLVGYADYVPITEVSFKIRNGERNRCLRLKERNVHAYAVGHFTYAAAVLPEDRHVTYNPYNDLPYFYDKSTFKEVTAAAYAVVGDGQLYCTRF